MAPSRETIARDLLPSMTGKLSSGGKLFVAAMLGLIGWGAYGLFVQLTEGHIVLGTRDHVVWGIYIVNFIFFIGLGYAGSIIAALLYLGDVNWRAPIVRAASIMMLVATIIGPIYILLEMGRLDRLHHLFIYGRIQSPIFWDVVAVSVYLIGCFLFVYLRVMRDFAYLKDEDGIPLKRKKWYEGLSLNYRFLDSQDRLLKQSNDILAVLIIPVAIIVSSILSWIFGMTLRPGWHSTIFGPYFVLAALYSGLAMVVIILMVYRKFYSLDQHIQNRHFTYLAYGLVVCGIGYGYFSFSEYFTDWYTSKTWNAHLIDKLFSWEHYGAWTFAVNFGGILIPIILLGIPKLRHQYTIFISSVLIVVSLWIKRYLIVIPTLENTLIPMQELNPEYAAYGATWVEWSLVLASFAAFALMVMLIARFVGVVPICKTAELSHKQVSAELKISES